VSEQRSKRILVVALVWVVLIGAAATLYKLVIAPKEEADRLRRTGSKSRFASTLRVAHDSFSGYCILRSEAMQARMADEGVRLEFVDDGADGSLRIQRLRDGEVEAGVFTVDALLRASAAIGEFPATIVLVLDESRGADAMLAPTGSVHAIDDLDHPDARVVCVADSPSETLARLVYSQFNIAVPLQSWLEPVATIEDVYRRVEQSSATARRAFVLWEPWVTKATQTQDVTTLVDSGDFKGYVVDVLVVSRSFLAENESMVDRLVEAYLRTAYETRLRSGGMSSLVKSDAETLGASLTTEQAEHLVSEIHWKNTLENYAHFGLLGAAEAKGIQHLEDVVHNLAQLLVGTGALPANPLAGRESWLFYDGILQRLRAANFHPGELAGAAAAELASDDPIEQQAALRELSDTEWSALVPVGTLRHEPISFARGTASLNLSSQRSLEELATKLGTWPHYYLFVVGHARAEGDPAANRALALDRARSALDELQRLGVPAERLRALAREPQASGGEAQSVSFELVQAAY
jgi:outer membrane protein OmpA-like peptidoglycan-associated protein